MIAEAYEFLKKPGNLELYRSLKREALVNTRQELLRQQEEQERQRAATRHGRKIPVEHDEL